MARNYAHRQTTQVTALCGVGSVCVAGAIIVSLAVRSVKYSSTATLAIAPLNKTAKLNNVVTGSTPARQRNASDLYQEAFVINRRGVDVKRMARFNASAQMAGVNATPAAAVDKSLMDLDRLVLKGEISPAVREAIINDPAEYAGPYACTLSHNRIWRKLVRRNPDDQVFLIFEDDSEIPPNFHAKLKKAMESVPTDWDLLYLNHNELVGEPLPGNVWLMPDEKYAGRARNALLNAYLVRPAGLARILAFQHPINYPYSNDDNLRRHFADFSAYFLIEPLVPTVGGSVRISEMTSTD